MTYAKCGMKETMPTVPLKHAQSSQALMRISSERAAMLTWSMNEVRLAASAPSKAVPWFPLALKLKLASLGQWALIAGSGAYWYH